MLISFVILLIPGQQSRENGPMRGEPSHNCRGAPSIMLDMVHQAKNRLRTRSAEATSQVGVTLACEPSWPHTSQVDTRRSGFCCLTARLPVICLVVVPFAPTIHQSHRKTFIILSSFGGLPIMQTPIS